MRKPLTKEGRDALFEQKQCLKNRKENFSSLFYLNYFFLSVLDCLFLRLFSNKTQNCLFFVLLRCFLTLATLFGSYIFLLFVSVMEQCNAHFIDDGSTNIKMLWEQDGETFTHISPNSFKRGWSATFGSGKPFNYTVDDEKYSFDLITPDALPTNNIDWQYSPLNSIAVHHALLTSGLEPQDVEIVVTLPLTEFYDEDAQYRLDNIERKKRACCATLN